MDVFTIISAISSLLAIPTIVGLLWKELFQYKKENSKKRKEEKKAELQQTIREVVQEEIKPVKGTVEKVDKKLDLVGNGTKYCLRNNIKNSFYGCFDKGYRNDYDYQDLIGMYHSYHDLGGNSFVDDIMERFDKLPPKEDFIKHRIDKLQNMDEKNIRAQEIKKRKGGAN